MAEARFRMASGGKTVYPSPESPRTVTRLLQQWSAGDEAAMEELLPLV